eukprot:808663_1
MWSLLEGLMIQAKTQTDTQSDDTYHCPVLISLLNPLEELRPISLHLLNPNSQSLYIYSIQTAKVAVKFRSKRTPKKRIYNMFGHNPHKSFSPAPISTPTKRASQAFMTQTYKLQQIYAEHEAFIATLLFMFDVMDY